jgi:hypothetical protein
MRSFEPLTPEIIARLGGSENIGSIRVEWLIVAGCGHGAIVEHSDSRRAAGLCSIVVVRPKLQIADRMNQITGSNDQSE